MGGNGEWRSLNGMKIKMGRGKKKCHGMQQSIWVCTLHWHQLLDDVAETICEGNISHQISVLMRNIHLFMTLCDSLIRCWLSLIDRCWICENSLPMRGIMFCLSFINWRCQRFCWRKRNIVCVCVETIIQSEMTNNIFDLIYYEKWLISKIEDGADERFIIHGTDVKRQKKTKSIHFIKCWTFFDKIWFIRRWNDLRSISCFLKEF